jgi:hypothetical protein
VPRRYGVGCKCCGPRFHTSGRYTELLDGHLSGGGLAVLGTVRRPRTRPGTLVAQAHVLDSRSGFNGCCGGEVGRDAMANPPDESFLAGGESPSAHAALGVARISRSSVL